MNITRHNVIANRRARAGESSNLRLVLFAGLAVEVGEEDVGDGEWRGEFETEGEVGLSVALIDFDGVVDIVDYHGVVGDVLDHAGTTAALEITGQGRGSVGPDFDASAVLLNCENLFI